MSRTCRDVTRGLRRRPCSWDPRHGGPHSGMKRGEGGRWGAGASDTQWLLCPEGSRWKDEGKGRALVPAAPWWPTLAQYWPAYPGLPKCSPRSCNPAYLSRHHLLLFSHKFSCTGEQHKHSGYPTPSYVAPGQSATSPSSHPHR